MALVAYICHGLTDAEYAAIKDAAKQELPCRVSFRRHRQVGKHNFIDIRPTKKDARGWPAFDAEEVAAVIAFMRRHELSDSTEDLWDQPSAPYVFRGGFNYLYRKGNSVPLRPRQS